MAPEWMAGLKRDDFAADCGSAATQFRCRFWIGSDTVFAADSGSAATQYSLPIQKSAATQFPLPILDRQRCSLRCRYKNQQRPSFAADSLIGSDVVSAAGFRIGNDAAIAMESGWIARTNKRLVSANGIWKLVYLYVLLIVTSNTWRNYKC